MWLSMAVFWSLFVLIAYYAIKRRARPASAQREPRAAEILEERYARGELSAQEYRERRETLETAGV